MACYISQLPFVQFSLCFVSPPTPCRVCAVTQNWRDARSKNAAAGERPLLVFGVGVGGGRGDPPARPPARPPPTPHRAQPLPPHSYHLEWITKVCVFSLTSCVWGPELPVTLTTPTPTHSVIAVCGFPAGLLQVSAHICRSVGQTLETFLVVSIGEPNFPVSQLHEFLMYHYTVRLVVRLTCTTT